MIQHSSFLAPAKLNLFLKVLGKRGDGYHDLISLITPITLFDEISIDLSRRASKEIELVVDSEEDLTSDDSNLVYRAAKAFVAETGTRIGIKIRLRKNIPIAAGLGGGSSDAATTLLGLNYMLGGPLGWKDLYCLGQGLGADVPALLFRRPCIATGIGDILSSFSCLPTLWFILIIPPVKVLTKAVYGAFKMELTTPCSPYINLDALQEMDSLLGFMANDLERVTSKSHPEVKIAKEIIMGMGARGAFMSGSGPSVFGVFQEEPGEDLVRDIKALGYEKVFKVRSYLDRDWGVVKR